MVNCHLSKTFVTHQKTVHGRRRIMSLAPALAVHLIIRTEATWLYGRFFLWWAREAVCSLLCFRWGRWCPLGVLIDTWFDLIIILVENNSFKHELKEIKKGPNLSFYQLNYLCFLILLNSIPFLPKNIFYPLIFLFFKISIDKFHKVL